MSDRKEYNKRYYRRKKKQGLVLLHLWVPRENRKDIKNIANQMREDAGIFPDPPAYEIEDALVNSNRQS